MSDIATSKNVGESFCEALGIDPKSTRRVTIELEAGAVVRVTVERFVGIGEMAQIGGVIREQYELVPKPKP